MERVNLLEGDIKDHVALGAKGIRDGYVICAPLEHGYVFIADAFSEFAVRAMHVLRGDPLFTAAQVIVGSVKTTEGIIREVTPEIKGLMKKFWPGMVSLNLRPQLGLSWDLGDNNQLDRVSVRLPKAKFAKALVSQTGPLAIASAARKSMPAPQSLSDVLVLDSDVALKFDNGKLRKGPISTVIEADETGVRVLRIGAVSLEEIQAIIPGATSA